MNDQFHFEMLGELSLCVSAEHKFGTDAFLLSDFAAPRRRDAACDLGTGCGIVALCWYRTPIPVPGTAPVWIFSPRPSGS